MTESFNPDWTINPSRILRAEFESRGWTLRSVAEATGVSKSRVAQYLDGDPYPATWAVAFAKLVCVSPQFIWNLQCNYQLDLALGRTEFGQPDDEFEEGTP